MRSLLAAVCALLLALTPALAEQFQGRALILTDGRSNAQPAPLIIVLHGFTGTAKAMQRKTDFDTLARRDGSVVAYPNGQARRWNDGAIAREGPDDVAYLSALIAALIADGRADPRRVFITGHSNGGGMALRMACARPDLIAGISVVAMNAARTQPCPSAKPVPAFFIHGMQDPIVRAAGSAPTGRHGGYLSGAATLDIWSKRNRCTGQAITLRPQPPSSTTYTKYRGCAARLFHLDIADHGHEWPGAGPRARAIQGPATTQVDAADVSWQFFMSL